MQRSFTTISVLLLGLLAGACSSTPSNTTADVAVTSLYEGEMPSAQGQKALHKVRGVQFVDKNDRLGGGVWIVGTLSISNVNGQLLPCVELNQGKRTMMLPMLCDGDVNYLYEVIYEDQGPFDRESVSPEMKTVLRASLRK